MRSRYPSAVLLSLASIWACVACENGSPPPGEACHASGGVCSTVSCGASLPYPCSDHESCCLPPPSSRPDGGTD